MPDSTLLPGSRSSSSRTGVIAINSLWLTVDQVVSLVGGTLASIAVARKFGPDLLGYYSYLMWLVAITSTLGRFGLPMAIRKYMSEFFGNNKPQLAGSVFRSLLTAQTILAIFCCAVALVISHWSVPSNYQLFAAIGILSVIPNMILGAFTSANMAAENLAPNAKASLVSLVVNLAGVFGTVFLNWGLVGLSVALLASRCVDLSIRAFAFRSEWRRLTDGQDPAPISAYFSLDATLDPEVKRRLIRFCLQSTFLQALNLVVWDRSEMVFLKHFSPIRETAFYSLAFSIIQQTSSLHRSFTSASGVSLMRRHGEDQAAAARMAGVTIHYTALLSLPICFGLAALSKPIITLLYGAKYEPAILVLTLVGMFGSARAFLLPAEQYMIASDRQDLLIRGMLLTSVANILFGFLFIPKGGALGAAICNGLAQTVGVIICWTLVQKHFSVPIPWRSVLRITTASALMAGLAAIPAVLLPTIPGLVAGVALGVVGFVLFLRLFRCLQPGDRERLQSLGRLFPKPLRVPYGQIIQFLSVPANATPSSTLP